MKAIINNKYCSPDELKLAEIEKPAPGDNEVLIKVHAASMNAADWHIMRGAPYIARVTLGLTKPKVKILGADVAGTIEAIGKGVKEFNIGDEVFGDLSSGSGKLERTFGSFAEYVTAPSHKVIHKPANLTFLDAAAIPLAAMTALQGLKRGGIRAGQSVLINGASGGVGTFAVQIAKAYGAYVTAVCSTAKVAMARNLGADHVIDYTKEDFTTSGKQYDLILAANGNHPIAHYKRALKPQGQYVMVGGGNKQLFQGTALGPFYSEKYGRKLGFHMASSTRADLLEIRDLVERGKLKPVVEKIYPLEKVPEAMRYIEAGHVAGKLVVNVCALR
jgi:NADPH:quinone reductase-like Zn-dependent oxidoreductase